MIQEFKTHEKKPFQQMGKSHLLCLVDWIWTRHHNDKPKPVFPFRTSRPLWCCPVSAALDVKLSTNMVGGKQIILIFFFLQPLLSQEDCDPVFGDCGDPEECDDVFGECGPTEPPEPVTCDAVFDDCGGGECLSVNEIDDTVFNR